MKKIEVCLSPELIPLYELKNKVVVIVDVLRASSTMVTALANGVKQIRTFSNVSACEAMKNNGYLIAGERGGDIIKGFDLGNSPLSFLNEKYFSENLALTTTNGTLAIKLSEKASKIIIGAMINLEATAKFLQNQDKDVVVFCAGWKGKVNLEDTLFAGALIELLLEDFLVECDASVVARAVYRDAKDDVMGYLKNSSHVNRLAKLGIIKDIEFCLTPNQYDIVPELDGDSIVVK
ncbi:MAG: 2-phosphosulfolactate phosphatase [Cyclobacteriaceae bacterium]|nr:2-phosphosulfolactate phosphatase [Cyclobacteriaceae bacterium]